MFIRTKRVKGYTYLQVVENLREGRKTRQRVVATLGRLDRLQAEGDIEGLLRSLARFQQQVAIQQAHAEGSLEALGSWRVGPALVFGRLWEELKIDRVLRHLLEGRRFQFDLERVVFASTLHRLFESGSDRQAVRWLRDVAIPGSDDRLLHHFYRAMRWLGETKDAIEEALFAVHRDLFTQVQLVFYDTTSFYFEGQGGSLGAYGYSRDDRPDRRQVVVGVVLTEQGRPVCMDVAAGHRSDAKALLPMVRRLKDRFGLRRVCWVADGGMVSEPVIRELEELGLLYILGTRLRALREVREEVLGRAGRYRRVEEDLWVKEVWVGDRRYVVAYNPQEAARERATRRAILESLQRKLQEHPGALVGNRGFRRFLKVAKEGIQIDRAKVRAAARYDGKFVLRTNTDLPAEEVARQYKELWRVEAFFRAAKSLLETRPVYHRWDATITGHLFVSFLALLLAHELNRRLEAKGLRLEWADILRDLEALQEVEVRHHDQLYRLRPPLQGVAGKVLQAVGVAIPPPVREVSRGANGSSRALARPS